MMRALTPETALTSTAAAAFSAAAAALRSLALAPPSPLASLRASYDPATAARLAEASSLAWVHEPRALRCVAGLESGLLPLELGGWRVGGVCTHLRAVPVLALPCTAPCTTRVIVAA